MCIYAHCRMSLELAVKRKQKYKVYGVHWSPSMSLFKFMFLPQTKAKASQVPARPPAARVAVPAGGATQVWSFAKVSTEYYFSTALRRKNYKLERRNKKRTKRPTPD